MTARDLQRRLAELNRRWLELARRGDFERAWTVSDAALELRRGLQCRHWPRHQQFIWNGASLRDRRVLIRCYHGLGDTLQFARFLPRVRELASDVVLWAQHALIPLLETLRQGPGRIIPLHDGAPDVAYDVDLELFEVMHALRVGLGDVVTAGSYLLPGTAVASRAHQPRRVGLVWRSGDWDQRRSVPVMQLAPLGTLTHIEWRLLQRGPGLKEWCHAFGETPSFEGILDEARALRELDLLITVDTCSAHLAGALGVPVWTLLPHAADWRWMDERSDSPWYPTMTLIRQRSPGEWRPVIDQIVARLGAET